MPIIQVKTVTLESMERKIQKSDKDPKKYS